MTISEIRLIESWMIGKSYQQTLDFILKEMDCTVVLPIGRPMQTINSRYEFLQEAFSYVLNDAIDNNRINNEEAALYRHKLEERHRLNLEFEKIHGVIKYGGNKNGKSKPIGGGYEKASNGKRIAKSIKTKDLITGEDVEIPIQKPKKETISDRKAKELKAKFANMKFDFSKKADGND